MASYADRSIIVNESISKMLRQAYGLTHTNVVLNCQDIDSSRMPMIKTNRLQQAFNIPDGAIILLFQEYFSRKTRNIENIVRALPNLHNENVVLLLKRQDYAVVLEIQRIATAHGMWNTRVFYIPAVTKDILLEYICSADAGIIPYLTHDKGAYYCTPNKMFEFMVAGLPILASDMPELKRFISGQGIGLNRKMIDHMDIAAALNDFF